MASLTEATPGDRPGTASAWLPGRQGWVGQPRRFHSPKATGQTDGRPVPPAAHTQEVQQDEPDTLQAREPPRAGLGEAQGSTALRGGSSEVNRVQKQGGAEGPGKPGPSGRPASPLSPLSACRGLGANSPPPNTPHPVFLHKSPASLGLWAEGRGPHLSAGRRAGGHSHPGWRSSPSQCSQTACRCCPLRRGTDPW